MGVGGYRHNYEDFYEKSLYQMSINIKRMTITQGAHASLVKFFLISYLSLLVKNFEEEIQPSKDCEDTARGYTLE